MRLRWRGKDEVIRTSLTAPFEVPDDDDDDDDDNNNNTGPSRTNKKLQELYFEAARQRWAMQKMWKRVGNTPAHYCSMWAFRTYRVCKETWWTSQIIHQKLAEPAELIDNKSPYYKYTPANILEYENFKLYWNSSILTDKTVPFNRPDITFMYKKTKNTFLIDIAVPICAMWKHKAAQVIPIVI